MLANEELGRSGDAALGKLAYEAYCSVTGWKSAVTGADLPSFDKTSPLIQRAWVASAKSVIEEYKRCLP